MGLCGLDVVLCDELCNVVLDFHDGKVTARAGMGPGAKGHKVVGEGSALVFERGVDEAVRVKHIVFHTVCVVEGEEHQGALGDALAIGQGDIAHGLVMQPQVVDVAAQHFPQERVEKRQGVDGEGRELSRADLVPQGLGKGGAAG